MNKIEQYCTGYWAVLIVNCELTVALLWYNFDSFFSSLLLVAHIRSLSCFFYAFSIESMVSTINVYFSFQPLTKYIVSFLSCFVLIKQLNLVKFK